MSRPPGMSDTAGSRYGHSSVRLLHQDLQTPFGFYDLRLTGLIISHCDPSRIISSVLQLRQAAKQDRGCLLFSYISYNSTHNILSINEILTAFLAFLLQKRPQTGRTSPFLYPVFKRVYSTMYFKICHYEIPIMFLSLRPN